jgi:N-acetylglucosamine-6-phosphate deacetylase
MPFSLACERIITPDGIRSGYLHLNGDKIVALDDKPRGRVIDYRHAMLMPGFVDIHVHGWGRGSFAWKGERNSLRAMSQDLVNAGVTSWLATSATQSEDFYWKAWQPQRSGLPTPGLKMVRKRWASIWKAPT